MTDFIAQQFYPNGLCLVSEAMPGTQSVALTLLVPGGTAREPADQLGLGAVTAEMICRGTATLDARAHCQALDQLGVQRSSQTLNEFIRISAVMLGSRLAEAFPLLIDMIRRPRLDQASVEPAIDLALQAIDALEDSPQEKVFITLRQRHYPCPFNRSSLGTADGLQTITLDSIRRYAQTSFVPRGAILGIAGHFDQAQLNELVEKYLGNDWQGTAAPLTKPSQPLQGYEHVHADSAQVHIGLALDAPAETDPNSDLQRVAVAALSGGSSSRLFTQLREKRGLCYSVDARYTADHRRGAILGYVGTSTPRAQESLDVMTEEIQLLSKGITAAELDRAKVGLKSALIMQGESTSARAFAIAADQHVFGQPRSLSLLAQHVDAVQLPAINTFLNQNPSKLRTITTIGQQPLTPPLSSPA